MPSGVDQSPPWMIGASPRRSCSNTIGTRFAGATSSTPYGIDFEQGTLVTLDPANLGTLHTIGSLGIAGVTPSTSLDITAENRAFLSINGVTPGENGLYSVNLATGSATFLGDIASPQIRGIAVAPTVAAVPEPSTFTLLGMGLVGLAAFRRGRQPGRGMRRRGAKIRQWHSTPLTITGGDTRKS